MRNNLRDFQEIKTKKAANKALPALISQIDKLAKRNVIHANKAANLKSKVTKHIASL
jgi:small subunit ribosomal protein S20